MSELTIIALGVFVFAITVVGVLIYFYALFARVEAQTSGPESSSRPEPQIINP